MADNVVSISPGPLQRDRKTEFLAQLGGAYDDYIKQSGDEPAALVYVLGGAHQGVTVGWTMREQSQGAACAVLARASCALSAEVVKGD